jgi:hypothetical protein
LDRGERCDSGVFGFALGLVATFGVLLAIAEMIADIQVVRVRRLRRKEASGLGADWSSLAARRESEEVPQRPSDWLRCFREIYVVTADTEYGPAYARLSEELGELAEAVRLFRDEPNYFLSEAAGVFAWIMRIDNIREMKARTPRADPGSRACY